MTTETKAANAQQPAANDEAAYREAYQYWEYLIRPDKCGTEKLDRLLRGIAGVIVSATSYGGYVRPQEADC